MRASAPAAILVSMLAPLLAGCGGPTGDVEGVATMGPVCGGPERDPPDPNCADRPYEGPLAVTTPDGQQVVARFDTAADGSFLVAVAPGTYVIANAPGAPQLPACTSDGTFDVRADRYAFVRVACDTGIR